MTGRDDGYDGAAAQTYVLRRNGHPWVTASVTRASDHSYSATLGAQCRPDRDTQAN